jgi:hypothetical protein
MSLLLTLFQLAQCLATFAYYPQRLDHFSASRQTVFYQEYVVDATHSNATRHSRVVLEIPDLHPINRTSPFSPSVIEVAKQANATLVSLQLRYFVANAPNDSTLLNCSVFQILADYVSFLTWLTADADGARVVAIGGGYGGSLAAWLRIQYPQAVCGSWSSSSPLLARPTSTAWDFLLTKLDRLPQPNTSCRKAVSSIYVNVSEDLKDKNTETFRMFGFDPNSATASSLDLMSAMLYSVFWLMDYRNDETGFLNDLCDASTLHNVSQFAVLVERTLSYFHLKMMDLSPMEKSSTQAAAYWRLKCFELGNFPDFYNLNVTSYQVICHERFDADRLGNYDGSTNLFYNGTNPAGESMLFSLADDDLDRDAMVQSGIPRKQLVILNCSVAAVSAPSADLRAAKPNEDRKLGTCRSEAIRKAANWVTDACNRSCIHGLCVEQICVCGTGWNGDNCDHVEVTVRKYQWIITCLTLVPTIFVLLGTLVAWKTVLKESEEYRPVTLQKA